MKRISFTISTALLLAAVSGPFILAQQPPSAQPVFRSGTKLVVENVTVKDKNGKAVEGLTAKDFDITEDGEPQTIQFVEFQKLLDVDSTPAPVAVPAANADVLAGALSTSSGAPPRISSNTDGSIRYRDRA